MEKELSREIFYPAVDIYEGDKDIILKAELPGMKKRDVQVEINVGVISLKGERKIENEKKKKNYHCIERNYGSFHRSFALPATVDTDKIKTHYQDGILEVILPRAEEARPKSIPGEVN